MAGKGWPESKKREVFEAFALSENYAGVSRETGVPPSTVKRWCVENAAEIARIQERNREIAEKAIEESLEQRMSEIAQFGKEIREKARKLLDVYFFKVTPGGIASLARAGVEIEMRALGEATETVGFTKEVLDALIGRQVERLKQAREGGTTRPADRD